MSYVPTQHDGLARGRSRLSAPRLASVICLLLATGCAEEEATKDTALNNGTAVDSGTPWTQDTGTPTFQDPVIVPQDPITNPGDGDGDGDVTGTTDSGTSDVGDDVDASTPAPGNPFDDLFGNKDAGTFTPPPDGGGEWTLKADSAPECPPEPPPIPIIGGACLGIYYSCGWTNPAGQTYSCVCDWIHWLCL
jgi:hypothetical protein